MPMFRQHVLLRACAAAVAAIIGYGVFAALAAEPAAAPTSSDLSADPSSVDLMEWLKSEEVGGYISPKVTYGVGPTESSTGSSAPARADYGHRNSGSSTSLSGMYALAPISKGEAIITVPSTYVITSGPDRASYERQDMCATARNLARERRNGPNSKWAPYVSYCFDSFPHEHLPSNWSKDALALFNVIVGNELPPQDIHEQGSYRYMCLGGDNDDDDGFVVEEEDEHISKTAERQGNEDYEDFKEEMDEVLEAAFRIVTARGWHGTLLPVLDMVNHHNGKFHNVDQANSAHEGKDVTLVALRDIQAGEQLYISYNECNDLDCAGIALTYTTPQIFADYGFVEQYPRRFNLNVDVVFQLDMNDQGSGLGLEWLEDKPDHHILNRFHAHLQRLRQLNQTVVEGLETLEEYEQFPIRSFYDALVVALEEAAAWNPSDEDEKDNTQDCKVDPDETKQCSMVAKDIYVYDPLNDRPDITYDDLFQTCANTADTFGVAFSSDDTRSFYQNIEFRHYTDTDGKKVDTCLWLDFELHSCISNRAHYHEHVVHYPAQYVPQVKRVLFLGGGDSMILHEVLKYKSLELVVGMELDHVVVRKSFQHFRTEPHFEDDRVQWWFGDASKSIRMLPDSYLGSFDLVILDLVSLLTDTLMVSDELSILDYSMQFLNEGGVLSSNEDTIVPTGGRNARFGVDLMIADVPVFCVTSISISSNVVDFLRARPVDHDIDSLVFRPGSAQKFHSWWNYWNNNHMTNVRKVLANDASDHTHTSTSSAGVMSVLEAEGVVVMKNGSELYDTISHALQDVGLSILSSSSFKTDVLFIALREGYVVLRTWPQHNYCAFDLMLWSNREMDNTISAMATAVGAELSSSYRIVMSGGMSGVDAAETTKYPAAAAAAAGGGGGEKSSDASIIDYGPDAASSNLPFGSNDLNDEILVKMIASMSVKHKSTFVAVVLCPNDTTSSCQSLKVLEENSGAIKYKKVVALYDCSIDAPPAPSRNVACEEATREVLISTAKIGTIIIDPQVSRRMGQILHKVLRYSKTRRAVLADNYLVLAASLKLNPSDLWRQALLERFRTDITIFSKSHHAEIFFRRSTGSHLLQVGIFSSGRADFLSRLAKGIEQCEFETGIISEVQYVRDGMPKYIPDFEPSMVAKDADYDRTAYDEHWKNQNPLGMQTISQFEARPLLSPLAVGERVLAQYFYDGVPGEWYPANIEGTNNDGTYNVVYFNGEQDNKGSGLARDSIRKWEAPSELSVSEIVLVKVLGERSLYLGKVVESFSDKTYKVRAHKGLIRETAIVEQKNLIRRFENPEAEPDITGVSCTALKEVMQNAATAHTAREEVVKVSLHDGAGDGCVITTFWSNGNAVATWDGGKHVNLNLFTFEESTNEHRLFADSLGKALPIFSLVSLNEQPRGSGRVVSFKAEMAVEN